MKLRRKDYRFGPVIARYLLEEETGAISLVLLPKGQRKDTYDSRRQWLQVPELVRIHMDAPAWQVGSLVHLSVRGEPQSNGAGNTLKHGASTQSLRYCSQETEGRTVTTHLKGSHGLALDHHLTWLGDAFRVEVTCCNHGAEPVVLDLLTSFSLDNLSPYDLAEARSLRLHRFCGGWSMEGLHITDDIESLNLASPWTYAFPESERFGVVGSHPAKRFFPVCAVEDMQAGVFWGASLAASGSWQMELSRDRDCYSLSGGVGDCETTAWSHTLRPGDSYSPAAAYVAVGNSMEEVCRSLYGELERMADTQPATEQTLPVVFNEWCTTWGNPSHQRMMALADALAGTPVRYLVIDAGWTNVIPNSFGQGGNGDWEYAKGRFPGGLLATSRALREKGFLTGIWFEFEVTTKGARVYGSAWDAMHLQRGGRVVVTGDHRSFWDFRKPEVVAYLKEKVLDFLRDNELTYLKVDYNGSIGVGCDGGDSWGDGLQEHLQAVLAFFDLLRREMPYLVIENCASGGHRLTIPFLERCAMASFSDAHEGPEIPVLAARLHYLVPPRQLQIWAVLHPEQSIREMNYRLAAGFLGRFCLSGEVDCLSFRQQEWMRQALQLYTQASPVIRKGSTGIYGQGSRNLRHLTGWQVVLRRNENLLLAVIHVFGEPPESISVSLPEGPWTQQNILSDDLDINVCHGTLRIQTPGAHSGAVILLKRAF